MCITLSDINRNIHVGYIKSYTFIFLECNEDLYEPLMMTTATIFSRNGKEYQHDIETVLNFKVSTILLYCYITRAFVCAFKFVKLYILHITFSSYRENLIIKNTLASIGLSLIFSNITFLIYALRTFRYFIVLNIYFVSHFRTVHCIKARFRTPRSYLKCTLSTLI